MHKKKINKNLFIFLIILLSIIFFSLIIISFNSGFKKTFKNIFQSNERQVLGTLTGKIFSGSSTITVVKIRENDNLYIEIYKEKENKMIALVQRIQLKETKDGYINFRGQPANLIFTDINENGSNEILVPTFDDNIIPRLHVFTFSTAENEFKELDRNEITIDK